MAKRGRKPKPEAIKILEGTRADRINLDAPAPIRELPRCPDHLLDDAEAHAEWDRIVPQLDRAGVLSLVDGAALAIYCSVHSRWVKAKEEVRAYGLTISTAAGGEKTNPAVGIVERCEGQLRAYLTEFGCTPSSRTRVRGSGTEQKKDRFAAYMDKRKRRSG